MGTSATSIAVLPFQNMSRDPEQEYFAGGMVEDIITELTRIRWLFVIVGNSTFTYKSQAIDVKWHVNWACAMSSKARCARAAISAHHGPNDRCDHRRQYPGRAL